MIIYELCNPKNRGVYAPKFGCLFKLLIDF